MNELTMQSTTAAVGSGRPRGPEDPGMGRSAADYERGVELFILAAATFFRAAAPKPSRGRRRAKAAAAPAKRRTVAKRASAKAE